MERLTKSGKSLCDIDCDHFNCTYPVGSECKSQERYSRLAAYEDTERTPEEVFALKEIRVEDAKNIGLLKQENAELQKAYEGLQIENTSLYEKITALKSERDVIETKYEDILKVCATFVKERDTENKALELAENCIDEVDDAESRGNPNDWVRNAINNYEQEKEKLQK